MPIVFRPNIYKEVIKAPYDAGLHSARVITGFASSSFIYHVVHCLPSLSLEVTIGMAKHSGVSRWDHLEFKRISETTNRLTLRYFTGSPPVHTKGVLWGKGASRRAFAGSSNFSWNGFRDFGELMASVDPIAFEEAFPTADLLDCRDPAVDDSGIVVDSLGNKIPKSLRDVAQSKEVVHLPLYSLKTGKIHSAAGLNWGQRPEYNREPNQAYIPIPKSVHDQHEGFFPNRDEEFTVVTDDGESFVCVVAQDNSKAVETRYDNSILGRYFRKRLGVPLGNRVELEDLKQYGRMDVSVHKVSSDLFFLDFSV